MEKYESQPDPALNTTDELAGMSAEVVGPSLYSTVGSCPGYDDLKAHVPHYCFNHLNFMLLMTNPGLSVCYTHFCT